jgi:hypothetical protein
MEEDAFARPVDLQAKKKTGGHPIHIALRKARRDTPWA